MNKRFLDAQGMKRRTPDQMKNGKSYEDQLPEEFYDEFYGQFPELNNY